MWTEQVGGVRDCLTGMISLGQHLEKNLKRCVSDLNCLGHDTAQLEDMTQHPDESLYACSQIFQSALYNT